MAQYHCRQNPTQSRTIFIVQYKICLVNFWPTVQLRPSPSSVALHPLHFSRISVAFSSRTSHRNEYTATLPSPKCSASLPYYIAPLNCLLLSLHKLLRLLSDFPPSQAGSEWMGIFVWASSALSGNDIRQMGLLKVNEPQVFDA